MLIKKKIGRRDMFKVDKVKEYQKKSTRLSKPQSRLQIEPQPSQQQPSHLYLQPQLYP